jgi:hypothetical protein
MIILAVVLLSLLLLVGILIILSPGTPKPFLDERGMPVAGSISEKLTVNIREYQSIGDSALIALF